MCDQMCLDFARSALDAQDIAGKSVLEVGSLDVNGSARSVLQPLNPATYVGVDIASGRGVDVVCASEDLVKQFGRESFDVVVSTEMLEHVLDWRRVVSNLKNVMKPGGSLVITTRRIGFPFHGYPYDFWRYEREDFEVMFSDLEIRRLDCDDASHGIFLRAVRPDHFVENDLTTHRLFSILSGTRRQNIRGWQIRALSVGRRLGDAIYPLVGHYRNLLPPILRRSAKKLFVRHYGDEPGSRC
jgi:SAM-dependent methyltransferase